MKKEFLAFKFVRPLLALVIVGASFAFMFAILYKEIPANNRETVNLVVGFMLGITATVGAYYFGTSKDKSDTEQSQRFSVSRTPVNELLAKCKDNSLIMSERLDWFKKLQEQYPEYSGIKLEDLK